MVVNRNMVMKNLVEVFGSPVEVRNTVVNKYTFEVSFENGTGSRLCSMCGETEEEARQDLEEEFSHKFEAYLGKRTYRLVSVA